MVELLPRHFVEKPWGRTDLPEIFGVGDREIGEVWFDLEGDSLPTLVKWLFTSERLSIQVHPDDNYARANGLKSGKEECWIVTHAEEGATLGIGLTRQMSPDELREAALSGDIETLLDWKAVQPGDWYYIPAGTIHAIGAGVRLVEVQQNADVTYRLYDYGRPRPLHLDEAMAVSITGAFAGAHGRIQAESDADDFVQGPGFSVSHLSGSTDFVGNASRSLVIPLEGSFSADECTANVGDVLLVDQQVRVISDGKSRCLLVKMQG